MQTEIHIDGEILRAVMRRVPSPVAVVTAAGEKEKRGITVGSFTSVSLSPPLISFNVGRDAQMHELITVAERFAVHILGEQQVELSKRFALPETAGTDQLQGIPYHLDGDGLPILHDVLAILFCRAYAVYPAGDHSIIVGEVMAVEDGNGAGPMVYYNRSYRGVGRVVASYEPVTTNLSSSGTP
jgi:3-hydroxy-9,10-secoandrosta-1,3,5(10)-triene-9,17-dione monooxygenase reductase component